MIGELLLQTQEALLVARLDQFMDNGGGGGEAGLDAMLTGGQAIPIARWVLPTPLGPGAMMFFRRSTNSARARSRTNFLLSVGMTSKSNVSRLFMAGNLAALMRRSTMRASRSINSNSISRAR